MKINSINTYIPTYKNNINFAFNNKVQNDVFVKTEQVSFGKKKKSRDDMIKDFARDVKKYYFDEPFDRKAIEKLIQKDVKDVSVKDFADANCSYKLPEDFMGLYGEEIFFDDEKKLFGSKNRTLYLPDPREGKFPKSAYYANCVHEYTHLLQSEDEETSEVAFLNRLLKKSNKPFEFLFDTIALCPSFAVETEKAIKKPIFDSIDNHVLFSKYLKKKPSVSEVYADNGINNIKKYALNVIDENAKEYAKKNENIDEKILKEFVLNHLKKENEAYQVDYETHKKADPNVYKSPLEWDKLVKIQLYRLLAGLKN